MKNTQDQYVASVECYEVKSFRGTNRTDDGTVVWLSESDGYAQVSRNRSDAKRFPSPEVIKARAPDYDGMPWYYNFKPGTLRIFKIESRPVERIVNEPVDVEIT